MLLTSGCVARSMSCAECALLRVLRGVCRAACAVQFLQFGVRCSVCAALRVSRCVTHDDNILFSHWVSV
jgi:hypothetical protein